MTWTTFWDMHSGGNPKEKYGLIFIEAPQDEAVKVFYNRFGHSPYRVSCTCCGEDYSIDESESLQRATAYHRNCAFGEDGYIEKQREPSYGRSYQTLEEYEKSDDALIIHESEITDDERKGSVPAQGYVWVD